MQSLLTSQKNIVVVVLLVILLGGGYYFFMRSPKASVGALGGVSAADAAISNSDEQDLINQLLQLQSLKLDESIFTDPSFTSLTDYTQTIAPEPVGRSNPFLPVGVAPAQ
jgi:hypothetical protein